MDRVLVYSDTASLESIVPSVAVLAALVIGCRAAEALTEEGHDAVTMAGERVDLEIVLATDLIHIRTSLFDGQCTNEFIGGAGKMIDLQ